MRWEKCTRFSDRRLGRASPGMGHLSRKSFRPLLHALHASTAGNGAAITVISHRRYLMNAADALQQLASTTSSSNLKYRVD
jgi:hypothetical protein